MRATKRTYSLGPMSAAQKILNPISRAIQNSPWLVGLPREVGVVALIAFFVALGFGLLAPAIPLFANTFGVSAFAAGAIISVFALMRLVSTPGVGTLVNKLGERKILTTGLAFVGISSFVAGLSQNYLQLIMLRGVGGIGSAMFSVAAFTLLLRVVKPDQRGRAANAFQGGFLIGGLAGPAIGGIILAWSVRAPFFIYGICLIFATVVASTMLSKKRVEQLEVQAAHESGDDVSANQVLTWHSVSKALGIRAYQAALANNFITGFIGFGLRASVLPLFVVIALGGSPALVGIGFLISSLTQVALLLPGGRLTDNVGRKPAMLIGAGFNSIGMLVLLSWESTPGFLVGMVLLGAGGAYLGAAPAAVVGDMIGGRKGGPVLALSQMMMDIGTIAGPLIAGLIVDQAGYPAAFAVSATLALVVLVFTSSMRETKGSPAPNLT